jgi:hypothetical protein
MKTYKASLLKFRKVDHAKLFDLMKTINYADELTSEKIIFSLCEISEIIEKIYLKTIPSIISQSNISKKDFEELFDEIKFDFNEIRQLIETADLID